MVKRLSGRAILFIENLTNQAIETFMLYKLQNWLFVTAFIKRKNIKPKQQKTVQKGNDKKPSPFCTSKY